MRKKANIFVTVLCSVVVSVLAAVSVYAESVFLEDGSIVEGDVIEETDTDITVRKANGIKVQIPRQFVLRRLETDKYKNKVRIHKKDGTVISGFIVLENPEGYTVRKDLNALDEIVVGREEVNRIEVEGAPVKSSVKERMYSPKRAAAISLIPFRSGSSLTGYTALGATFCVVKTGALVIPLSFFILASGFGSTDSGDNGDQSTGNTDIYANEAYVNMVIASFAVWICATAADVIYSYHHIRRYNERKQSSFRPDDVSIILSPRFNSQSSSHRTNRIPCDGLNISFRYLF